MAVARGIYDLGSVRLRREDTLSLELRGRGRASLDSLVLVPMRGPPRIPRRSLRSPGSAPHGASRVDLGIRFFRRSARRILPPRILRDERQGRQMLPRYLRRRLRATPRQPPATDRATWTRRAPRIRAALARALDLPPRRPASPPRVRHLSTETRGPLLVERLFIEGSPGIWASALLYRPIASTGRLPAVLHTLGHYGQGKHYRPSLIFDTNLAVRGFVVLSVDALGMGERAVNKEDHHFRGLLHWLVGQSTTGEMVGEVLRFVDYLRSRPDVDPARVGLTGSSGGGTLTMYATAVDTRIAAAAPLAAVADWPWLFRFIGGDPEMYPHNVVAVADYATLLRLAAPRPVLVGVGRRDDMFPPRPARRVVQRARDAYRALGAADHLRLFVDRFPHGLKPGRRQATYRFFQEHLGTGADDRPEDVSLALFSVTTGPPPCTRTLVSRPRDAAQGLPPPLRPGDDPFRALAALAARRALLERTLARPTGQPSASLGVLPRGPLAGNPRTSGLLLQPEPGVSLPSLLVRGRRPSRGTIIYVADGGRLASCHAVTLAEAGFDVLLVDLLGLGETTPTRRYRYGLGRPGPLFMQDFFGAALLNVLGDSLMAMRVSQLRSVARWLLRIGSPPGGAPRAPGKAQSAPARARLPVALLGEGTECGVLALVAAALEPRVAGVAALGPLGSFRREIDQARFPAPGLLAYGLLEAVDLPQLMAMVAPRPLLVLGSRGPDGRPTLSPALSLARSFYRLLGHPHRLAEWGSHGSEHEMLLQWARQVAPPANASDSHKP